MQTVHNTTKSVVGGDIGHQDRASDGGRHEEPRQPLRSADGGAGLRRDPRDERRGGLALPRPGQQHGQPGGGDRGRLRAEALPQDPARGQPGRDLGHHLRSVQAAGHNFDIDIGISSWKLFTHSTFRVSMSELITPSTGAS